MPGARKIPIGVFDPVFNHLSLDQMIEKISALGIEAVEMGTGGYPGTPHCPVQDLLTDNAKLRAWKKKFEDRNIQVAVLSCHGNPVHPDAKIAERDAVTVVVQINGKVRDRLEVPAGLDEAELAAPARSLPKVQAALDGKTIRREIVVPDRLVNLVVG
jgi:sugar phosphate isomerase/epimerase